MNNISINSLYKFNIKQLISFGLHLGHHKQKRAPFINQYLLGHRNNIDIFNLNITINSFKTCLPIINNTIYNNGFILIIAENAKFLPNLTKQFPFNSQYNNSIIYTKKWVPGVLTNFKQHTINSEILFKKIPDLIIILNTSHPNLILNETNKLKIPSILFNDSNINPFNATYIVPTNDDSITCTQFYLYLIKKAILSAYAQHILEFKNTS